MTNVRDARRQLGLTQIELGAKLGVHQAMISRLETGAVALDERTALAIEALLVRHAAGDSAVPNGSAPGTIGEISPLTEEAA